MPCASRVSFGITILPARYIGTTVVMNGVYTITIISWYRFHLWACHQGNLEDWPDTALGREVGTHTEPAVGSSPRDRWKIVEAFSTGRRGLRPRETLPARPGSSVPGPGSRRIRTGTRSGPRSPSRRATR